MAMVDGAALVMHSETLGGTPGAVILIPPGTDAEIELAIDNPRNLDIWARLNASGGRNDNVYFQPEGRTKARITLTAPALWDRYLLTLETGTNDGLRVFAPYRLPTIICSSSDKYIDIDFTGCVPCQAPADPDIDFDLGALPSVDLASLTLDIGLPNSAALKIGGADYDPATPSPLDFSSGASKTFRVTVGDEHHDYVVRVRHVKTSRGTGETLRYYPDLAGAVAAAAGTAENPDTITVLDNITHTGTLNINGKHIKLTVPPGQNKMITLGSGHTGDVFAVQSGASLTFEGNGAGVLTVDGNKNAVDLGGSSFINVNGGGLYLRADAVLQNAKKGASNDGCIRTDYAGTITMTGGMIRGMEARQGGAVYLYNGTFSMSGGELRENKARMCGAIVYIPSGNAANRFTMTGGYIRQNTAEESGGAVFLSGQGTFRMTGGEISGNKAKNYGGAVCFNGAGGFFEMEGGTISGNEAQEQYGGAVSLYDNNPTGGGTFNMSGGTITGNVATLKGYGKGVYVHGPASTFNMSGSAAINADNDVYLSSGKTITVDSALTGTAPVITPQSYEAGVTQVLSGAAVSTEHEQFAVTPDGADEYAVNGEGKLILKMAEGGSVSNEVDGGTIYEIHIFTASGTFTIDTAPLFPNSFEILVVGGGGGGGGGSGDGGNPGASGGGGGGGVVNHWMGQTITAGSYAVTVGSGGTGGSAGSLVSSGDNGVSGGQSAFGSFTAAGGGGGAGAAPGAGGIGGSSGVHTGGAVMGTAGGGGAGADNDGEAAAMNAPGNGGDGVQSSITGTPSYYGGGGGAGGTNAGGGWGGQGGGGNGGNMAGIGTDGAANTGGGGAGGATYGKPGHAGGSGIVIIRFRVK
jgi:hypothetical protein